MLSNLPSELITGNGTAMDIKGQARMTIEIGGIRVKHNVIIANTDNQGMLGLDFLVQHDPTINVASGRISIRR